MKAQVRAWAIGLCLALVLAGCGGQPAGRQPSPSPASVLAEVATVPSWSLAGEVQSFDRENLFDLVDGQADAFFAYAFEQVAAGSYERTSGEALRVEVWQVATAADAYGLFTSLRSGKPVAVETQDGQIREGDGDPGRRLDFWQDRYLVRIFGPAELPNEYLEAFAQAAGRSLPPGGEVPDLMNRLPQEGLVPGSELYFHEEISLQSYLWLGGENLTGLGPETEGVWVRYELDQGPAQLLVIRYPGAAGASRALAALQTASLDNLVQAGSRDNFLAAVFGAADEIQAGALLNGALKNP